MPDFTEEDFNNSNNASCADTTCGRSVVVNEDPCPDCCDDGGEQGDPGKDGKNGATGRAPLVRCGCLPMEEVVNPGGGPVLSSCLEDLPGRVVYSSVDLDYYGAGSTSSTFFQDTSPGYANITDASGGDGQLYGEFTGLLITPSTTIDGNKNIVPWGYKQNNIPYLHYQWSYKEFKILNGNDGFTKTVGPNKFTFVPIDPLFATALTTNLFGWKDIINTGGANSPDLVDAFLDDFPDCATDESGGGSKSQNGQGADICSIIGGKVGEEEVAYECKCDGCAEGNMLTVDDCGENNIQPGDIFIDACNKIMYISASVGGFPDDGIPFAPECKDGVPCPGNPPCPQCPDNPKEPCGTCAKPDAASLALQPEITCQCNNVYTALAVELNANNCTCEYGGIPLCPKPCKTDPTQFYYKDQTKECPCASFDGGKTYPEKKCPTQCGTDFPADKIKYNNICECGCKTGASPLTPCITCQAGKVANDGTCCPQGDTLVCSSSCMACTQGEICCNEEQCATGCPECPPPCPSGSAFSSSNSFAISSEQRIGEFLTNLNVLTGLLTGFNYYVFGTMSLESYMSDIGLDGYMRTSDVDIVIDRSQIQNFYDLIKDDFDMDIISDSEFVVTNDSRFVLIAKTNNQTPYYAPIFIEIMLSGYIFNPTEAIGTLPTPSEMSANFGNITTKTIFPGGLGTMMETTFKAAPIQFTIKQKLISGRIKDLVDLRVLYFAGLITGEKSLPEDTIQVTPSGVVGTFNETELRIYKPLKTLWDIGDEANRSVYSRNNKTVQQIIEFIGNKTNSNLAVD